MGIIMFLAVIILFIVNIAFHDAEENHGIRGLFTVLTLVLVVLTFIIGFLTAESEYKVIETKTQLKPTMRIVCKDTICDTTYIYTKTEK